MTIPVSNDFQSIEIVDTPPIPPKSSPKKIDRSREIEFADYDESPQSGAGIRKSINNKIPAEIRDELRANEKAYDFAYVDWKGGCGSSKTADQWILVSNQRILYEATTVQPGEKITLVRQSGSIPISKVSFVGTATINKTEGCNPIKLHLLKVNSGGGQIELVMPTESEGGRLQRCIDDLISSQ